MNYKPRFIKTVTFYSSRPSLQILVTPPIIRHYTELARIPSWGGNNGGIGLLSPFSNWRNSSPPSRRLTIRMSLRGKIWLWRLISRRLEYRWISQAFQFTTWLYFFRIINIYFKHVQRIAEYCSIIIIFLL